MFCQVNDIMQNSLEDRKGRISGLASDVMRMTSIRVELLDFDFIACYAYANVVMCIICILSQCFAIGQRIALHVRKNCRHFVGCADDIH